MKSKAWQVLLALGLGVVAALVLLWRLDGALNPSQAQASANVFRVAIMGNDAPGCGSQAMPCASVQYAVDLAQPGDVVLVAAGHYTGVHARAGLTQVLYLSQSLTLQGGYTTTDEWSASDPVAHPTILDAQGQGRVLYVTGEVSVTLEGLRLTGGDALGADGGGLYAISATLTLRDSRIFSNSARRGGGAYVASVGTEAHPLSSTVSIVANQFFSNTAQDAGGGLYLVNATYGYADLSPLLDVTTTIAENSISNNVAGGDGGGLYTLNNVYDYEAWDTLVARTSIRANLVSGNGAGGNGGGLCLDRSVATLESNVINANRAAQDGGGVYLAHYLFEWVKGRPTFLGNTISANRAARGGGAHLSWVSVALEGNRVISNSAALGGGLYLDHSGSEFVNTVVNDNQADHQGSGLYVEANFSRFSHTTLARNHGGDGSGLCVTHASLAGSIYPFSRVVLTNTLIASHTVGITSPAGLTWTVGNAVIMDGVLWYANGTNTAGTGAITVTHAYSGDPAFASDGYHLTAASAAIDAGVPSGVSLDLDGEARPNGAGYDIGSDEFWQSALQIAKHAHPAVVEAGARLTYTLVVTNNGAADLPVTVRDTLPPQVSTDESLAGTVVLPGGELLWTPVISANGGVWTQQVVVTAAAQSSTGTFEPGYAGPLTNVVQATAPGGLFASATRVTQAVLEYPKTYLPLLANGYPRYENRLLNPGFEGIGLPLDNDAPNPDNYTQETYDGRVYSEIFTPEGWVTWWEESDVYRRPESRVIPKEPPYTQDPVRIYQGYYATMYFTFYGQHNAGYYQTLTDLPPNAQVYFYAHAHAWSCEDDDHAGYSCGNQENHGFRVGIDPGGGADPWSADVIWSERVSSPDVFRMIGPVYAHVGAEGRVTVFVRSDVKWWPYKHSDSYWDNAALMVQVVGGSRDWGSGEWENRELGE